MPNLSRFAAFAPAGAVVAPVAPAPIAGATEQDTGKCTHFQILSNPVAPVAPVSPRNGDTSDEDYWRDEFEERAAILEFDAGHSRSEAEALARVFVKEARGQ